MEDEIVMTMGQGTKCHEEIALDVRGRQEDLLRPDDLMREVRGGMSLSRSLFLTTSRSVTHHSITRWRALSEK
jgi:hypothetical protein